MRTILVVACVSGALSVVLGAMGAHALAEELAADSERGGSFEAALRYHQLHSVVLLVLGLAVCHWDGVFGRRLRIASWLFVAGLILFCGSLYGFAFGGPDFLPKISPFGGTTLIIAWLSAAWAGLAARGGASG
ncbi:MAG: DUF423 domain-containing protein [Opitutales bacterium]